MEKMNGKIRLLFSLALPTSFVLISRSSSVKGDFFFLLWIRSRCDAEQVDPKNLKSVGGTRIAVFKYPDSITRQVLSTLLSSFPAFLTLLPLQANQKDVLFH